MILSSLMSAVRMSRLDNGREASRGGSVVGDGSVWSVFVHCTCKRSALVFQRAANAGSLLSCHE